jgi:hypothetical protein
MAPSGIGLSIKIGNGLDGDMYAQEYHHHLDDQDLIRSMESITN